MNKFLESNRMELINLFLREILDAKKTVDCNYLSEASKELPQKSLHLSPAQVGQFIRANMSNVNFNGFVLRNGNGYALERL